MAVYLASHDKYSDLYKKLANRKKFVLVCQNAVGL
jgi:hypothetical protein